MTSQQRWQNQNSGLSELLEVISQVKMRLYRKKDKRFMKYFRYTFYSYQTKLYHFWVYMPFNSVPRQGMRVWLMENSDVISGFQWQKEWSECVVEACLKEAFKEKIPDGVDFEILMPVHSSLVKPTLAPGQVLNGLMVHTIFKEKPIYIRPSEQICDISSFSMRRSLEENQGNDPVPQESKGKLFMWIDMLSTF